MDELSKPILKWVEYTEVQGPSGLSTEEALAWMKAQTTPEIIYPDDCGGPHVWERFSVADSQCDCGLCEAPPRRWMECANCMKSIDPDTEEDFEEIWEPAPWG